MKLRNYMGIRARRQVEGDFIVYIDNRPWCFVNDEDFYKKFLPAHDKLQDRRQRVAQGEADVVLN